MNELASMAFKTSLKYLSSMLFVLVWAVRDDTLTPGLSMWEVSVYPLGATMQG